MTKQGLFKAVSLIAIVTILSKIAGFIRDLVIANAYGASITSDAYFYAYQIPSFSLILLGGLGGPFHTAVIAIFGKRLLGKEHDIPGHEQKLLNSLMTYTFIAFSVLAVIVSIFAMPIIKLITPGASPELQSMAAQMMIIMSPALVIGGLVGIFYGILNVYNKFFWPSFSPLIASIAIVIAVIGFKDSSGVIPLAVGTLIGAVGMIAVQLPDFFKTGFKIFPSFDFKLDGLRPIGEILFPAMIGTTIGQINVYVDMFFVSSLPPGGWTSIVLANRLIQLPIGVLLTAMLVPIFPMFTTFVAQKDFEKLKHYAHTAVTSLWLISFPAMVYILIFAADGVRVLLERGEFDRNDTSLVAHALIFLAFSIVPYMARDTITRIFYAFEDSKTPLLVGLIAIVNHAIFDWLLVGPLGVGGITLSTTLVTLINMILLTILLRKKVKDIGLRKIIKPTLKIILASIIMGGVCYLLNVLWKAIMPDTTILVLIKLIVIAIAGFGSYAFLIVILGLPEAKKILSKFSRFFPTGKTN